MNKLKFYPINEWKEREQKVRTLSFIHAHYSWCRCGCKEWSVFLILLGLGVIITVNPNIIKTEEEKKL